LSRLAQAFLLLGKFKTACPAALSMVVALSLSACATGGIDKATDDIDQATQTGALAATGQPADPTRISDETTIRNAVSAADPEQAKLQPLAWANADTGSRGAISDMMEKQDGGVLCRQFKASRESFDGVALYAGDACKGDRGVWYLRNFKPL
jgi:hypothetical protein